MTGSRTYPAKILLFGEYSLLLGYEALGIPFRRFSAAPSLPSDGHLAFNKPGPGSRVLESYYNEWLCSNNEIKAVLELDQLGEDIRNGLCIESDIPVRSGIGSSGALCAAIYGTYARDPVNSRENPDPETWSSLRSVFILMESWFHGRSSGFDPLLSYLDRPLRLMGTGSIVQAGLQCLMPADMQLFLADAGHKDNTAELIRRTITEFMQGAGRSGPGEELGELNNRCISKLIDRSSQAFAMAVKELSEFQFGNMHWLVPGKINDLWALGLKEDNFYLKLCGSGGGGFMLGFTRDPTGTAELFNSSGINTINVELNN